MKLNRLFYAIGIGCTLCACSSNEEPNVQEEQDFTKSNKYVSVAIVTANDGTRAAKDYYDGEDAEFDVNSLALYFFDRQGNYVYSKYVTNAEFKDKDGNPINPSDINPAVTTMATVEVELKANSVYDSVIAILNPGSDLFENGSLAQKTKYELEGMSGNYSDPNNLSVGEGASTKGNFVMSNSVFINQNYSGTGNFTAYEAVPITSHNIYVKDKKDSELTDAEKAERDAKAINIYVERVNSKIIVSNAPKLEATSYRVDAEGQKTDIEVNVNGGETVGAVKQNIKVIPVFQGMGLSVMAKEAYLLKHLNSDLTYSFTTDITFPWNDRNNKRSYWESTSTLGSNKGYDYTSWDELKFDDPKIWTPFAQYVNPNTANAVTSLNNEKKADKTTKLMVTAQLTYVDPTDNKQKPLDLVKYSDGYWMADYLIYHAATRVVENLGKMAYIGIADADLTAAKDEVKKITRAYLIDGETPILTLKRRITNADNVKEGAYLAELSVKDKDGNYPDFVHDLSGTLETSVQKLVEAEIQKTLDEMTERQIQYWKDGKTYFYVPVRHEGFDGMSSGKYLNGVVRNHVYSISINKIWGLGTPVIEPDKPIDPERPDDAPASYMTAKIHVLKWRVVNSNVTMH